MLDEAREWLDEFGIAGRCEMLALADHDCRVVNYLPTKDSCSRGNAECPDAASARRVFIPELSKATGRFIRRPWAPRSRQSASRPSRLQSG
eukprot:1221182-Pyramimonas_sp.AAC.1